jgi:hypothetical protein
VYGLSLLLSCQFNLRLLLAHNRTSDLRVSFFCFTFSSPVVRQIVCMSVCFIAQLFSLVRLSTSLFVCLSAHNSSLCLPIFLFACHSAGVFLPFPSVCLSACRNFSFFRLSASLLHYLSALLISNGASVCQSNYLPSRSQLLRLSASLLVCSPDLPLSVRLPVCLSAHGTLRLFSSVVDSYGYNRLIMEANKICRSAHYPVKLDSPWGVDQGGGERSGSSVAGFCAVRHLRTGSGTSC